MDRRGPGAVEAEKLNAALRSRRLLVSAGGSAGLLKAIFHRVARFTGKLDSRLRTLYVPPAFSFLRLKSKPIDQSVG